MENSPSTIKFPLSNGGSTLIDKSDLELVSTRKWGKQTNGGATYVRATSTPRVYLHQFLLPDALSVDHIDRDGLNNSRANLRPATAREQVLNRKKPKHGLSSRYRGVHLDSSREKWKASVGSRPQIFNGRFDYETEAALAYDREALKAYGDRAQLNFARGNRTGLPTVLFVGFGRAGKDAAAQYLSSVTHLRYAGSFSWSGLPFMADFLGVHPQHAWETRHNNRQTWKDRLDFLREGDPAFLAEIALSCGEVAAGLRDRAEIEAVRKKGLFTHIAWVHRPSVPVDPTVTFTEEDCDLTIVNDGTLEEFHAQLKAFATNYKLPLK